ncbi:MAG: helix-turn-helix transcriptional regulator [Candidatus Obscuribacterales bacterium]
MHKELREKPADADPLLAGVSRAIQERREEIGLSQEEVAHRAGLHRTYISDIERGARNPSLKTLSRLSEALEVPTSSLIRRGEDRMPTVLRPAAAAGASAAPAPQLSDAG